MPGQHLLLPPTRPIQPTRCRREPARLLWVPLLLRPGPGRNAQDHLVEGRNATIERIYVDFDGRVQLAVTVDGVPGQDIMRDIRRYLFFRPDEVERA